MEDHITSHNGETTKNRQKCGNSPQMARPGKKNEPHELCRVQLLKRFSAKFGSLNVPIRNNFKNIIFIVCLTLQLPGEGLMALPFLNDKNIPNADFF